MKGSNNITKFDLFATIIVAVAGTGFFALPSRLSEKVGSEGWLVVLLTGIVIGVVVFIQCKALEVNNYERIDLLLENNFGKIFGKFLSILIGFAGIVIISLELRTFTEVLKMFLLEKTPSELIIILMIFTGTFLIRGELESVIMFNEIAFYLMFVPVLLVIPLVIRGADFTNILPVLAHKPIEYLEASMTQLFSFVGFGIIYMVHPFLKEKRELSKVAIKSVAFVTIFYALIVIMSLAVFPAEYNKNLLWPTISMVSIIDIPGAFIERWEGVAMIFWIFFYFTTFVNVYYFSSEILKNTFNLRTVKISSLIIMPIIYIFALYPSNITELYSIEKMVVPFVDTIVIGAIPIILLLIKLVKKRRGSNEN